jgi:hypothetical protein
MRTSDHFSCPYATFWRYIAFGVRRNIRRRGPGVQGSGDLDQADAKPWGAHTRTLFFVLL